jgi:hypothetical protein
MRGPGEAARWDKKSGDDRRMLQVTVAATQDEYPEDPPCAKLK